MKMKIGVDYYPEHWDISLWKQDAELMQKTGVSIVRLAEFAWSLLEPAEGEYDFSWLDQAIALFEEKGIDIVLCTPTCCPPLWLYEKYPDSIMTGPDDKHVATGVRGHRCYTNPDFLRLVKQFLEQMTTHYANRKSIIAWQIDNEPESNFCMCKTCTKSYQNWMIKKYHSLDKINAAYGNQVWSGTYSSIEQLKPPFGSYPDAWRNPAYMLDYYRFASDSMIEYIMMQANIIRKNCPGIPITTNAWFCDHMPELYDTFKDLDFVSYDNYPTTQTDLDPITFDSHAFHLDLMRGVKEENFWIMEQLSGGLGSWSPMSRTTYPGMIKGYSLQALAHGADTIVHFRWRTATIGAEMHWHGLIDHSNVPGRRFHEFSDLCNTIDQLDIVKDTQIRSSVAILYSMDTDYAFKIQPQTEGMYYWEQPLLFHKAFMHYGVNTDIINHKSDFTKYKIVIVPNLYVTDPDTVHRLYQFTENGGTVILTNRTGAKNLNNNYIMEPLPTLYRNLTGCYVSEYNPIGLSKNSICTENGENYSVSRWCDVIIPENCQVLARYQDDFFAGSAAVTKNKYGKGTAYYIGTTAEAAYYRRLLKEILEQNEIEYVNNLPEQIELTTRENDTNIIRFLFNHSKDQKEFKINYQNHLEWISLSPYEMKIDVYPK